MVIHEGRWTVPIAADGLPEFIPPVAVDWLQRPRRNLLNRIKTYLHQCHAAARPRAGPLAA